MKRDCPVCGSKRSDVIKRVSMALAEGIPLPHEYDIVSCSVCGFCYADTSASKEDYDTYYAAYNNYSGLETSESFEKEFPVIRNMLETHLRPSDSIVDIGFGNGHLLLRLRELGYGNLTGVDPSQSSVEKGRAQGIRTVQRSVYDDPGCLQETFDAVLLTSVIEHLLYPKEGIRRACSYLKNEGYLIVELPDYSMCHHVTLPVPNQFNQEHINYFSKTSFANLLRGTGLQVLCSESVELKNEAYSGSEFSRLFLLRKCAQERDGDMEKDVETRLGIERYLLQQERSQEQIRDKIRELYLEKTPLVVWGTGSLAASLLASSDLAKCNIAAFADGNVLKAGTCMNGIKIISPEDIQDYPDAVILICAMQWEREIRSRIAELKLKNRVISLI